MQKKISLLLVGLFTIFSAIAQFVHEKEAALIAEHFINERIQLFENNNQDPVRIGDVYPVEYENVIVLYEVQLFPEGFVLVSASKAVKPVLGYAYSGSFNHHDLPSNCKAWISQYKKHIHYAFEEQISAEPGIESEWNSYLFPEKKINNTAIIPKEIEPLLHSRWDQGLYYNEMCPEDPAGPGGHCVTGCVPTAMGQICNYFRFPDHGTGEYSYECPPYGTLYADFENTEYKWEEMATEPSTSNLAIAELLFHLGVFL
jgi:hypothetical protein